MRGRIAVDDRTGLCCGEHAWPLHISDDQWCAKSTRKGGTAYFMVSSTEFTFAYIAPSYVHAGRGLS